MRRVAATAQREREAPEPPLKRAPLGFWLLAGVYLLLLGVNFVGQQQPSEAEAEFRLRDIEADIRMVESMAILAPDADLGDALSQITEVAGRAVDLAQADGTPPPIAEQAAAIWLIFRPADATADSVTSLLPAEDARGALSECILLAANGEMVVAEHRAALLDIKMSRWLLSRLTVYLDTPGELPEATSSHAARETEFGRAFGAVFLWFMVFGLIGLGLLIALPYYKNRLPGQGLRSEMTSPFRPEWWSGWYALFFWSATQGAAGVVVGGLMISVDFLRPYLMLGTLAVQIGAGVLTFKFIGLYVTASQRSFAGVIADLRAGLGPFDGKALPALGYAVGGYAIAIPILFGAAAFQSLLPFTEEIVTNPVLVELVDSDSAFRQLVILFSAVVAAPIFEEAIFRGVLYRHLRTRIGIPWAVVVTSLCFSIMHPSLTTLIPLFALGCILALVTERSGSVLPAMLMHALWNGAQLLLTIVRYGG
ncbi:MAG: membrane protease YdiL (CAAX protease family) [Myxococcota bacterium]